MRLGALMDAYLDGDPQAFRRLYSRVAPRIRRQVGAKMGSSAAVDDVVQLTFMRAHASRGRFTWPDADANRDRTVVNWYCAIARNTAIDALREDRRPVRHTQLLRDEADLLDGPRSDPESVLLDAEARHLRIAKVREAIRALPNHQREILELHRLGGLKFTDLVDRLGASAPTLRVRAHRAYRMLANALGAPTRGGSLQPHLV